MTEWNKTEACKPIIHEYACTELKDTLKCLLGSKELVGIIILICILGLIGNGVVFCLLGFCIKRNFFSVYVLNLAVADFGTLLATVSMYICVWMYLNSASTNSVFQEAYNYLIYLYFFMLCSSIHFLTAMSVDRSLAMLFPVWHRCHRPKNFSAIVSAILWGIPCVFLGLLISSSCWKGTNPTIIISFTFFISIMVISTLILSIKLCCNPRLRQRGKIHVAILLSLLFFLVTTISICLFVQFSNSESRLSSVTLFFICINSSSNPVIYFLFGRYCSSGQSRTRIQGVKDALWRFFNEEDSYRNSSKNSTENSKVSSVLMSS